MDSPTPAKSASILSVNAITDCSQCNDCCVRAKILPCGHVICKQCQDLLLQTDKCRVCKRVILLQNISIHKQLSSEFVLQDLVIYHLYRSNLLKCTECLWSLNNDKAMICVECEDVYCETCSVVHEHSFGQGHEQKQLIKDFTDRVAPVTIFPSKRESMIAKMLQNVKLNDEAAIKTESRIKITNSRQGEEWKQMELKKLNVRLKELKQLARSSKNICLIAKPMASEARDTTGVVHAYLVGLSKTDVINDKIFGLNEDDLTVAVRVHDFEKRLEDVRRSCGAFNIGDLLCALTSMSSEVPAKNEYPGMTTTLPTTPTTVLHLLDCPHCFPRPIPCLAAKLLPCGHLTCKPCLSRMLHDKQPCSICGRSLRSFQNMQGNEPSTAHELFRQLSTDFICRRLVQRQIVEDNVGKMCELCQRKEIVDVCYMCKILMCRLCYDAHIVLYDIEDRHGVVDSSENKHAQSLDQSAWFATTGLTTASESLADINQNIFIDSSSITQPFDKDVTSDTRSKVIQMMEQNSQSPTCNNNATKEQCTEIDTKTNQSSDQKKSTDSCTESKSNKQDSISRVTPAQNSNTFTRKWKIKQKMLLKMAYDRLVNIAKFADELSNNADNLVQVSKMAEIYLSAWVMRLSSVRLKGGCAYDLSLYNNRRGVRSHDLCRRFRDVRTRCVDGDLIVKLVESFKNLMANVEWSEHEAIQSVNGPKGTSQPLTDLHKPFQDAPDYTGSFTEAVHDKNFTRALRKRRGPKTPPLDTSDSSHEANQCLPDSPENLSMMDTVPKEPTQALCHNTMNFTKTGLYNTENVNQVLFDQDTNLPKCVSDKSEHPKQVRSSTLKIHSKVVSGIKEPGNNKDPINSSDNSSRNSTNVITEPKDLNQPWHNDTTCPTKDLPDKSTRGVMKSHDNSYTTFTGTKRLKHTLCLNTKNTTEVLPASTRITTHLLPDITNPTKVASKQTKMSKHMSTTTSNKLRKVLSGQTKNSTQIINDTKKHTKGVSENSKNGTRDMNNTPKEPGTVSSDKTTNIAQGSTKVGTGPKESTQAPHDDALKPIMDVNSQNKPKISKGFKNPCKIVIGTPKKTTHVVTCIPKRFSNVARKPNNPTNSTSCKRQTPPETFFKKPKIPGGNRMKPTQVVACLKPAHVTADNQKKSTPAGANNPKKPTNLSPGSSNNPAQVAADNIKEITNVAYCKRNTPTHLLPKNCQTSTNSTTDFKKSPHAVADSPKRPTETVADNPKKATGVEADNSQKHTDYVADNSKKANHVVTDNPTNPTRLVDYNPKELTQIVADNLRKLTQIVANNPKKPTQVEENNPKTHTEVGDDIPKTHKEIEFGNPKKSSKTSSNNIAHTIADDMKHTTKSKSEDLKKIPIEVLANNLIRQLAPALAHMRAPSNATSKSLSRFQPASSEIPSPQALPLANTQSPKPKRKRKHSRQ